MSHERAAWRSSARRTIGASTATRPSARSCAQGYDVYPINPHETQIEGLSAYRSVPDVPGPVEMATMYVPPEIGMAIVDDLARKGVKRGVVQSRRRDPGTGGARQALGLQPIEACSIMGIGDSP